MTSHLLRTALYVPADNAGALVKAEALGADAVIVDLEDSVAPGAKASARQALTALPLHRGLRVIRVNASGTDWHEDDIRAAVATAPDALLLPKASSAEDIWGFRRLILLCQPASPIATWAMIETPAGVLNVAAIAAAVGPGGVLVLGLNDLAKETGMAQAPGRAPMQSVLTQGVIAARAHGIAILDGVFNKIADEPGFEAECRQARQFGFDGKTVIHPRQIGPANAIFAPGTEEIAEAEAIVAAFRRPENAGKGVVALSGRMVERLHRDAAEALLAKAAAIAAKA